MGQIIRPGDMCIDATVGNGHDTLFMAQITGPDGHVYGFDIQENALANARQRLDDAGVSNTTLFLAGHETMIDHLSESVQGRVGGVMFNLGYLPGSDEVVITGGTTSCRAIDAGLSLMRKGGVMSLVLYTGHPGGAEEAEAVEKHCASLDMKHVRVMRCAMHNHPGAQTSILLLEKR